MFWNRKKSNKKLRKEEEHELLEIIRVSSPNSERYENAIVRYKDLCAIDTEEKKSRNFILGRILDIVGTFGLAGLVLTSEYWAPITSSFGKSITSPFRHNDSNLLM